MSGEVSGRALLLRKLMIARRKALLQGETETTSCPDPYAHLYPFMKSFKRRTVIGTAEDEMIQHYNDWDAENPENPDRLLNIIERMNELNLPIRCEMLQISCDNVEEDIKLVHEIELIRYLKEICGLEMVEREDRARYFDAVYFNRYTYEAALRAVKWTLTVLESVCDGKSRNGYAIVRPPGHHAQLSAFEGYCYFNNVAIAAEKSIRKDYAKKVMIVDFDVHHGNGTQEKFYRRRDVLYFSIHRYENGTFWPNLPEGNFDAIGKGPGVGYNVNVPLNETGLGDSDYMAIIFNLLLPIAYEYNPELILFSAGYDAAIGCPEGEMRLSPGFYSHLVQLLSGVGKTIMVLEGGYFRPSLSESVCMSVKGLLDDPCPILDLSVPVRKSVIDTINNCKGALHDYWKCFSLFETFTFSGENESTAHEEHIVTKRYYGEVCTMPYETVKYYPVLSDADEMRYSTDIDLYRKNEDSYKVFKGTGYSYDKATINHVPPAETNAFENPDRIECILKELKETRLQTTCKIIESLPRDDITELCLEIHSARHMDNLEKGNFPTRHDLYVSAGTNKAALAAVSVLVTTIDAVMKGVITNGAALIRPPGHHAGKSDAQGFCFLNNVAIAAKHLQNMYSLKRILIFDFDIHHGNGTQDAFYLTNEVLYISIHRYDDGTYYPYYKSADIDYVGHGPGEGFNVNIPFSGDAMGNSEYMAAFTNVVLPISYAFKPEFVLVSAGFDASAFDPLGGYRLTPETYGHMVNMLKPLANGRVVLALEGGYNTQATAYGMIMCMKALAGEPIPMPKNLFSGPISENAAKTIRKVLAKQHQYWPILLEPKKFSDKVLVCKYQKLFNDAVYDGPKYSNYPEG